MTMLLNVHFFRFSETDRNYTQPQRAYCFCSSPCLSALPDALSSHSQLVNELQTGFQSLENKLSKEISGQIAAQFDSTCHKLQKSIDDLSLNIDKLITRNSNIQMEIDNTSESISAPAQSKSYASAASPSNSALSITDELADQEKRRKNVIVYNFPEASDRKVDSGSFLNMCKEVYNSDISVNKVVHLEKKSAEKQRPLLRCLKHDADESLLFSQLYLLRGNNQYSDVFIVPDRTKFERKKHKKLVKELKERRSQGVKDLVIRNGVITSKHSRSANQQSTGSGGTSDQLS